MEKYDVHFKSLDGKSILLTFLPGDRTDEVKYKDGIQHGPIIQKVVAHNLIDAKRRILKLVERC